MKRILNIALLFIMTASTAIGQNKLISGPWAGNVNIRDAAIWAEVSPAVKKIAVEYFPEGKTNEIRSVEYKGSLGNDFNPVKIFLPALQMNTVYQYRLRIDGKIQLTSFDTKFKTQELWQWRKPAPDFSFLAGSCSYFNEPLYDRPGKPYGNDSSIFETMANTAASFHVWLGDNWYTREVDFNSAWGLNYRASHDRSQKVLQKFMAAMPQYAIWDDHDYGPNDAGKSFILKNESREIFKNYSLNPSYGEEGKGIYSKFSYSDIDIFLTDDRYFRSEDEMPDSINGKPSSEKTFFGPMQLEWLKNALQYSNATFKIIATGSQVLNTINKYESMQLYSYEYNDLMSFIADQKISGVLFFTGDRHHSEILSLKRRSHYTLYDITISPYTSGLGKLIPEEVANPARISGTLVEKHNFGKITVSGPKNNRVLSVNFIGIKGDVLGNWSVSENDLKDR